jgi:hypothetical protein
VVSAPPRPSDPARSVELTKLFNQFCALVEIARWDPCTAVQCTALHCTVLHFTSLHSTALHCTAVHCSALHCTALHCIALHCIALGSVHCGTALMTFPLPSKLLERIEECTEKTPAQQEVRCTAGDAQQEERCGAQVAVAVNYYISHFEDIKFDRRAQVTVNGFFSCTMLE